MKDNNVKFVRIKGRIVPIRTKQGSGSRGGRYKSKMSSRERGHINQGKKEVKMGLIGATALFAASLATKKFKKIGNRAAMGLVNRSVSRGSSINFKAANRIRKASNFMGSEKGAATLKGLAAGSFISGLATSQNDFSRQRSLASKRAAKIRALNKAEGR